MIVLELEVLAKGDEVGERLGNPQVYKADQAGSASTNGNVGGAVAATRPVNGISQGKKCWHSAFSPFPTLIS